MIYNEKNNEKKIFIDLIENNFSISKKIKMEKDIISLGDYKRKTIFWKINDDFELIMLIIKFIKSNKIGLRLTKVCQKYN